MGKHAEEEIARLRERVAELERELDQNRRVIRSMAERLSDLRIWVAERLARTECD